VYKVFAAKTKIMSQLERFGMMRDKLLKEVHVVCHQGRNMDDLKDGTFLTGDWVIKPERIRQGVLFALHETKAEQSYIQGEVLGISDIRNDTKQSGRRMRRVRLLVRKTPTSLPWRGRGSGEKGYVWS
jgi:hypothetical protein